MMADRKAYFITIAETRNITVAAQLLRVSQPSLSQYINRLEKKFGVKLLERNYTPLRLTKAGEIYLEYVKESVDVENRFEARLEEYKLQQNQALSVGIPTQLTPMIFGKLVQNFAYNHPDVKIIIKEGTSLSVLELLAMGEVDIAFFHTMDRHDPRFNRYILQKETLSLACNRDSVLAHGRTGTAEFPLVLRGTDLLQIEKMRFLTLSKNYYLYHVMADYLQGNGISPKKIIEIPNSNAIVSYLLSPKSDGVSMLAQFMTEDLTKLDELTFFNIDGDSPAWYLTMNCMNDTPLTKIGRQFWTEIQEKAKTVVL